MSDPVFDSEEELEDAHDHGRSIVYGEDDGGGAAHKAEESDAMDEEEEFDNSVGIEFCDVCHSMMRPKEDKEFKKLYYKCFSCGNENRSVRRQIVTRNQLRKEYKKQLHIYSKDLVYDPTLSRRDDIECPDCSHNEAVMFLGGSSQAKDENVNLVFMCCSCQHAWIHGEA